MQTINAKLQLIFLAIALTAGTSGCSSGGGDSDAEAPTPAPASSSSGGSSSSSSSSNSSSSSSSTSSTGGATKPGTVGFAADSIIVAETAGRTSLSVVRSGANQTPLEVAYTVTDGTATAGSDYVAESGTIAWASGENGAKSIGIDILQDDEAEGDEQFTVTLNTLSGDDSLGELTSATVTISDAMPQSCIELEPTRIVADTRLAAPCYLVNRRIEVLDNATLSIAPGVRLEFDANTQLRVHDDGVLEALGTEAAPIIMTGQIEAPGYWDGVILQSLGESKLNYVTVVYGGASSGTGTANLVVDNNARASISNSTFAYSSAYGVELVDASAALLDFSDNILSNNQAEPLVVNWNLAGLIGEGNRFENNVALDDTSVDRIILSGSNVNRTTKLANFGVPYLARSTGFVDINASLTIEPGVTLIMREDSRLWVESGGALYAKGTAEAPITFTATTKVPGAWYGIGIFGSAQENIIEHAVVEYAGADSNFKAAVGVGLSDSKLTLNDSILRHSQNYGLQVQGSGQTLTLNRNTYAENARPVRISATYADDLDPASTYTGNNLDIIDLTGQSVSGVGRLRDLGALYRVSATRLELTDSLTIDPGVTLQFPAGGMLSIDRTGSLVAQGSEAKPILFTGIESTKGYWQGIQFTFSQSEANLIQHAIIEYGGGLGGNTDGLVGLFGNDSFARISDTLLRSSATNGIDIQSNRSGIIGENLVFEDIDMDNILQE